MLKFGMPAMIELDTVENTVALWGRSHRLRLM